MKKDLIKLSKTRYSRGFTLIELLVVIAIIGVLASVVLSSLNSARAKGRDAKRRSDAHQITLAIEMYFNSVGSYPASGGATAPNSGWSNSSDTSWATLATILNPYMRTLSSDPKQSSDPSVWGGGGTGYAYSYINCGNTYMFVYSLENSQGADPGAYCGATFYQYGGSGSSTNIKTLGNS